MLKDGSFDRAAAGLEFLDGSDIPARYHALMQTVILMVVDTPESSLREICSAYAVQHGQSPRIIEQKIKNAVCLGWEYASTPSSMLFSRRMQPEDFVRLLWSGCGRRKLFLIANINKDPAEDTFPCRISFISQALPSSPRRKARPR